MERKHLSKTGEMLLSNKQPNHYTMGGFYGKTPNFLDTFSSRAPTEHEIREAQKSLSLLKSKMDRKPQVPQSYHTDNNFARPPPSRPNMGGGGEGNYRKVFRPGNNDQLSNLSKKEQLLQNNLNMLDDNLNMQREIIGARSDYNRQPNNNQGRANMQGYEDSRNNKQPQRNSRRSDRRVTSQQQDDGYDRVEYGGEYVQPSPAKNSYNQRPAKESFRHDNNYGYADDDRYADPFGKGDNRMQQGNQFADPYSNPGARTNAPQGRNARQPLDNYMDDYGSDRYAKPKNPPYISRGNPNKYQDDEYNDEAPPAHQSNKRQLSQAKGGRRGDNNNGARAAKVDIRQGGRPPIEDGERVIETIAGNTKNDEIMMEAQDDLDERLFPCPEGCGRRFKQQTLVKHAKICKKVFQTKRKKFDATAMRADGDEQLKYAKEAERERLKAEKKKNAKKGGFPANSKPDWKKQSEGLRAMMKANRITAGGGKLTKEEETALAEANNVDRDQCKFCGRKFGKKVLEKHIISCGNKAKMTHMRNGGKPMGKKR